MNTLRAENICLRYGERIISNHISLSFEKSEIISIIGPNGSGKSTLLKGLSRILKPDRGTVYLNGRDLSRIPTAETARSLAVLSQSLSAPGDLTVRDLTACGRIPHHSRFSSLGKGDTEAIDRAMRAAGVSELAHCAVQQLSGGERQRVWLAMALAQEPEILFLDEPTTYLDIRHQLDLMEMIRDLHAHTGIMVIMVLHDLSHAIRFSHRVIAMQDGCVLHDGPAHEVMTEANLEALYGVKMIVTRVVGGEHSYPVCFPCSSRE